MKKVTYLIILVLIFILSGHIATNSGLIKAEKTTESNSDKLINQDDGDGVSAEIEDSAANKGDGNGDGILDKNQASVASIISPITGKSITLVMTGGDCQAIKEFKVLEEASLKKQDGDYAYPQGLLSYSLLCSKTGRTATATVYFDKEYDDDWVWRIYHSISGFSLGNKVNYSSTHVGDTKVATISFQITEGGENDSDGLADASIIGLMGPSLMSSNLKLYLFCSFLLLIFLFVCIWLFYKYTNRQLPVSVLKVIEKLRISQRFENIINKIILVKNKFRRWRKTKKFLR